MIVGGEVEFQGVKATPRKKGGGEPAIGWKGAAPTPGGHGNWFYFSDDLGIMGPLTPVTGRSADRLWCKYEHPSEHRSACAAAQESFVY
jgi:hypothetical protein